MRSIPMQRPGVHGDAGRHSTQHTDSVLDVEDLAVTFRSEAGDVAAVRGVSYQVRAGEVLGIVGESGSGKSVSSLAVMGLLPENARVTGSVRFRERDLIGLSDRELSDIRGRRISMIFQDPLSALTPVYTVGDQIAEAVLAHNDVTRQAAHARAVELLTLAGIPNAARRASAFPHEFSGGMRQRVMIAMAMANQPDVIIADEPTTALDVTIQAQILDVLKTAKEATGAAIVLITHDLGVVAGFADRVAVMYAGRIVEIGDVDDVFYRPRMPYTLGLLGSIPRLDVGRRQRLTPIDGHPPSLVHLPSGCPFWPRCPLRIEKCLSSVEPALLPIQGHDPSHRAACHRSDEIEQQKMTSPTFSRAQQQPSEADAASRDTRTHGARCAGSRQTFPAAEEGDDAAAHRHRARGRRHQLRHPRAGDAGARRRVGLRQDDRHHGDSEPRQTPGRHNRRAGARHDRAHAERAVCDPPRPAGGVPGSAGVARSAPADWRHPGRAARNARRAARRSVPGAYASC